MADTNPATTNAAKQGGILKAAAAKQAAVATRQGDKTLKDLVTQMTPAVKAALPAVMTPERFTRIALSALSSNPALQESTPQSFLAAMMTAAQLGVEPNTPLGQAYLIPFRNHGRMETQFQLGYKGLIDLAYRSGEIKSIQAHEARENDDFQFEYGLTPKLRHIPAKKDRGAVTHYYACFETKGGGVGFIVMSKDDILTHAQKFSKAYGSGPWQTNFDEMAKKTVLKAVLKYAPLKSDFVRGLSQDESVRHDIDADMTTIPAEKVDIDVPADEAAEAAKTEESPAPAQQPAQDEVSALM